MVMEATLSLPAPPKLRPPLDVLVPIVVWKLSTAGFCCTPAVKAFAVVSGTTGPMSASIKTLSIDTQHKLFSIKKNRERFPVAAAPIDQHPRDLFLRSH